MSDSSPTNVAVPVAPLPWRLGTIALLLLACFIPRAVAAWNWDVLWGDTLHYLRASRALEHGNFERGFAEFGLNIYPLMLIPLRHLGIDWQIAGKWFNVIVATCTVVPIWGWLRRMFDDRTALLACLVYAVQGKLIAISPLIIRDSTFWFLVATTFYCLWRAANEARLAYYLAAGVALTLAVHTRTEGWLLIVPLLGWTACRWPASAGQRARLAVGTILCLAVIPGSLAVVNATWLREHPRWEMLRTIHFQILLDWLEPGHGYVTILPDPDIPPLAPKTAAAPQQPGVNEHPPEKAAAAAPPSILLPETVPSEKSARPLWLAFKLMERLAKALTWVGSLLILLGIICHWRLFLRPEHVTLLTMNVLLLVLSGIRYRSVGLDLRYFMPMVIVGLPWIALGVERLVTSVLALLNRSGKLSLSANRAVTASIVAILAFFSLLDAPLSAAGRMRTHAAMGRWIHDRSHGDPALAGNIDSMSLDTFYAQGKVLGVVWPRDCLIWPMPPVLVQRKADFVVIWNAEDLTHDHLALVAQRITDYCGYRRVDPSELPASEDELMVFVKK